MRLWTTLIASLFVLTSPLLQAQTLPGTRPLEGKDDLARLMVDGIGKYLDRAGRGSVDKRKAFWKPDFSSPEAYVKSLQPNRERLKRIIGAVDARVPVQMEYIATPRQPALVAEAKTYKVYAVRWTVLPGVHGEGYLYEPTGKVLANVIDVSDPGYAIEFLTTNDKLAQDGCRVLAVRLVDRKDTYSGSERAKRSTNQPHREFIYRMAYQMGRHIIGYEVQKILAAVDWFAAESARELAAKKLDRALPLAIHGDGEGGLLALYSAACDTRIETVCVNACFPHPDTLAGTPIYRNVWRLFTEFGGAEIAALIAPRRLIISGAYDGNAQEVRPTFTKSGAAPGHLGFDQMILPNPFDQKAVQAAHIKYIKETNESQRREFLRARDLAYAPLKLDTLEWAFQYPKNDSRPVIKPLDPKTRLALITGIAVGDDSLYWYNAFLWALGRTDATPIKQRPEVPIVADAKLDPAPSQKRQFDELVDYTQKLLPEAAARRDDFVWKKLNAAPVDNLAKAQAPLRDYFAKEIIGELPQPTRPMNPRTRQIYDTEKFTGYEVVLDLYDDVICHGILLVPKDIKPGEKRPVVVCQHGLEGRPTDVCNPGEKTKYYHSFGAQLANRGFVVFAPQNPYIFKNDFRQLVRKANPLGLTLYSFIVRQHERILDWLTSLPFVDGARIAYYGLSYGGKVAMRIPVLVGRYCVVICSGDFNEWIWKNITLDWGGSYMFTGEYEMFEFDLANTFNYAEMAALIAPRPFMVERGHSDGVGLDEYVAFEYAKVRRFYARLGIADRTEIEFFTGGHIINGQGTFAFLHKHLNWPAPK